MIQSIVNAQRRWENHGKEHEAEVKADIGMTSENEKGRAVEHNEGTQLSTLISVFVVVLFFPARFY